MLPLTHFRNKAYVVYVLAIKKELITFLQNFSFCFDIFQHHHYYETTARPCKPDLNDLTVSMGEIMLVLIIMSGEVVMTGKFQLQSKSECKQRRLNVRLYSICWECSCSLRRSAHLQWQQMIEWRYTQYHNLIVKPIIEANSKKFYLFPTSVFVFTSQMYSCINDFTSYFCMMWNQEGLNWFRPTKGLTQHLYRMYILLFFFSGFKHR